MHGVYTNIKLLNKLSCIIIIIITMWFTAVIQYNFTCHPGMAYHYVV